MKLVCLVVSLFAANVAHAGLTFSTSPGTINSTTWTSNVTSFGGTVDSSVDFDAHPLGALDSTFYNGSGVTITSSISSTVKAGPGPGEINTTNQGAGEGVNGNTNYLEMSGTGSVVLSFDAPVIGVGVFTIDKFTSSTFDIEVFSGANATGTSLGSSGAVGAGTNFQQNRLYFIGVNTDDASTFRSIRITQSVAFTDAIGFDNVRFATVAVPEPSSLMVLGGLGCVACLRRRRR
ncbi:MAG: hypothetical protein Aurels2KO_42460 [Aureliella sp.]